MKHLKSYKLFESISNTDLELDVKDIFLELEEDGYYVGISMLQTRRPGGVDMFCTEASRDDLFQWSDVKDYFERAKEYVCDNDWVLTKVILNYYPQALLSSLDSNVAVPAINGRLQNFPGSDWEKFRQFVTDPKFIEDNMIYEIALIFDPKK